MVTDEVAAALGASAVRVGIFLLIKASGEGGWIRLWSGVGVYVMAPNGIDTAGGDYLGFGELTGLPTLSQLINGVADRIEFTLSGVNADVVALADSEADTVRSAPVHLAITGFDDTYSPLSAPIWLWEGEADTPRISRQAGGDSGGEGSIIRTVSLSVGSIFTGRRRPKLSYFTGIDQRRRSSDDAYADRANRYSQGTTRKWP